MLIFVHLLCVSILYVCPGNQFYWVDSMIKNYNWFLATKRHSSDVQPTYILIFSLFLKAVYSVGVTEVWLCFMHKITYNSLNVKCDQIWKNPASTHTISNLRFHQKWITGSIHYHNPLLAFGAIGWSWLSCIGAWRAGRATKGWPMSVIFNLECWEHKKGPVGPQTGPLAFNYLRIPFCTPILSPPSSPHPPPLLLPPLLLYHLQYHYRHEKSCSKQPEFQVFESYSLTQL